MSLVGSEVDISIDKGSAVSGANVVSDEEDTASSSVPTEKRRPAGAGAPPMIDVDNDDVDDQHPTLSPPGPAEMLFMSNHLNTQSISAAALAQQIHQSFRSTSLWTGSGTSTVNLDDFATAVGTLDSSSPQGALISARSSDSLLTPFPDYDTDSDSENLFQQDVLSRNYPNTQEHNEFQESKMATTMSANPIPTTYGTTKPAGGKKFVTAEVPDHVDAAEKIYDTAKGVWGWGKGVTVIKPFLGMAEGVAGTFVGVTGNDLNAVDRGVVDKLHTVDDKILNPAIKAIVGILLQAAGKSEDVLKPIIIGILKPLGLIKDEAETPELTTSKPALTKKTK